MISEITCGGSSGSIDFSIITRDGEGVAVFKRDGEGVVVDTRDGDGVAVFNRSLKLRGSSYQLLQALVCSGVNSSL